MMTRVGTICDLTPATLLFDARDRSVRSFRHRSFSVMNNGGAPLERAVANVMARVAVGRLDRAKPGVAPTIPTCSACGCTEEYACEDGCSWANPEKTLCTSCVKEAP